MQQAPHAGTASGQAQIAMASVHTPPAYPAPTALGQPPTGMPAGGYPAPFPLGYQHIHQQQLQQFWTSQMQEIEQVNDFKNHQLPVARIKKIMKADEDVRMISAEAPVVFAKACELFILELTLRSWMNTEENKRRTLQKNDIASAVTRTDIFDFLVDIVPRDEMKDEGVGMARAGLLGAAADPMQYGGMYYMQQPPIPAGGMGQLTQGMMGSPGVIAGKPAAPIDAGMNMLQQRPGMPYVPLQPVQQMWQASQVMDMPGEEEPPKTPS